MSHFLTFDLGTTYFKAALFDEAGQLAALARVATPLVYPRDGWCEMAAENFFTAIRTAAGQLRQQSPRAYADIAAVSFATQANSFLLLDAADRPLIPIIIWTDRRGVDVEDLLQPISGRTDLRQMTGVPALTGEFSPGKLLWIRKHQPEIWSKARRFCFLSDHLTFWLTGRHATEAGMSSLSGMVDLHTLNWWPPMMSLLDAGPIAFPQIIRAGGDLGTLRPAIADELSLPKTARLIAGCLDQYAGGIGAGNIAPGAISETTGTVLATVRCSDRFDATLPPTVYQGPAFDDGLFYQMTFGSTSANLLEALRNHAARHLDYPDMTALAEAIPPGAGGLRLQPNPHLLPADRMFKNLLPQHTLGHQVRAVLEAVAFSLNDLIHQLSPAGPNGTIHSCGGAARSDLWLQIKADILDAPFQAMTCPEPTSQGAALLAARALGRGSMKELADRWCTARPPVEPDPQRHQLYRQSGL